MSPRAAITLSLPRSGRASLRAAMLFSLLFHGIVFGIPFEDVPPHAPGPVRMVLARNAPAERAAADTRAAAKPPAAAPEPEVLPAPPAHKPLPKAKPVAKPAPKPAPVAKPRPSVRPAPEPQPRAAEQAATPAEPSAPAADLAADQAADLAAEQASPRGRQPGSGATSANAAGRTAQSGPVMAAFGALGGPEIVRWSRPQYPRKALARRLTGLVVLRIAIDHEGRPTEVGVEREAGHGFDEAAAEAAMRSLFAPAMRDGRPVACVALLPVRFQLEGQ
ncbi:MAG: TonB family protein [Desulfovibrionaceae bacterium]